MQSCKSTTFGELEYEEDAVIEFQRGLPGFESETQFVPVERENAKPLLFLQSVVTPQLCFITIPVQTVDPQYQLKISGEDLSVLGTAATEPLRCLAVVCTAGDNATVNLSGPLVINPATRQGVQAIRDDSRYSAQQPLFPEKEAPGCS